MDWWLIGHITPILLGVVIASQFLPKYFPDVVSKYGWLENPRSRLLSGLLLVCLGGFTVSAHTLWFHNKFHELGSAGVGCASFGVFDCASVIQNNQYNTDPLFGAPWGVIGMLAFTLLAWLALSIQKDHTASWVETHLKLGVGASAIGVIIALYLVYVEIFPLEGVFCQYCTAAHLADLISLILFVKLLNLKNEGNWATSSEEIVESKTKRLAEIKSERKSSGGYVKPTTSSEEE